MRNGVILLIIITSFYLWITEGKTSEETEPKQQEPQVEEVQKEPAKTYNVTLHRSDGTEATIELEEYLEGVVGSEMPATFELEALKAQAVAARTFVAKRNFEVDDTTSSQVYQDDTQLKQVWAESYDERSQRIHDVVEATKGEVIKYNGEPITASFFSSSPGKTANGNEYWDSETPYLKSVDSHWDMEVNDGNVQTVDFTLSDFSTTLGFQNSVSQIGSTVYYDSGYVKEITIDGITFTGREIRESLKLRSSCFKIVQEGDTLHITTTGFGHGIGMSQYGAQGMALEGFDYKAILTHYYSDVEIAQLDE